MGSSGRIPDGERKDLLSQSHVLRFLKRFYKYQLTHIGKYLLIFGLLSPLFGAVVLSSSLLLYYLVSFTLLIVIFDFIINKRFLPKLSVHSVTPVRGKADSVLTEEITVMNSSRRNAYMISLRERVLPLHVTQQESTGVLIPLLSSGEEVRFKFHLHFAKRGEYLLDGLQVDSSFPLGIFRMGYRHPLERRILAYPSFSPLMEFSVPAGRKLQPGGIALASKVGESTEFLGTREFRDGDDPRFIHWASWARLNKPVVKEFQEEYFTRIALFLDSYVPRGSSSGEYECFEALLSLGASISDYLQRQEYVIDILCAGPQVYYLQAGRALAYLDQILDILACLDVCREKPYGKVEPHLMEDLSQVSTVIVLLLDWDDERRDFLMRVRDMGVDLRIFLISESADPVSLAAMDDIFGNVTHLTPDAIRSGVEKL